MMHILKHNLVTVRKPHRCEQCSRTINVGEEADYFAGRGDDGFQTAYQCLRCTYLIGCFRADYNDDEGIYLPEHFGDLGDDIEPRLRKIWAAPGAEFVHPTLGIHAPDIVGHLAGRVGS